MKDFYTVKQYSVFEIGRIMDGLRPDYDIVRLVDVEECRIVEVSESGEVHYQDSCFSIWGRENRCANCSSLRACKTHSCMDKTEHLGHDRENIHSIPIYLELKNGETAMFVIECVRYGGSEGSDYKVEVPDEFINNFDVLTRLFTQEYLPRAIRLRLNENPDETYLIIMSNIRNFSILNRLFGVEGGNRLLTGIADLLRRECTEEEIYGRYHDDRFVLFIKKDRFSEELFRGYISELEGLLDSPICKVQIKLGIYEIDNRNLPVSIMTGHADAAVSSIRDSKDEVFAYYVPGMIEHNIRERRIITDFGTSLASGEFNVFLQPQVNRKGEIGGGEALVRWIRPDGTIMLPGEFLETLQQSELLSSLDKYIWEKTAQLLCQWKGTDMDHLYLSVNVDPMDFYYLNVPAILTSLCEKYAIDPSKLHVEITEMALIEDTARESHIVDALHDAGFTVEIDDFGKGSSSLSLLKDIHADVLKIDMGFIQSKENIKRSEIILGSVIDMANNLNMEVIMEGVETREHLDKMSKLGCDCFQGFYFSRPVPVSDFEYFVKESLA